MGLPIEAMDYNIGLHDISHLTPLVEYHTCRAPPHHESRRVTPSLAAALTGQSLAFCNDYRHNEDFHFGQ